MAGPWNEMAGSKGHEGMQRVAVQSLKPMAKIRGIMTGETEKARSIKFPDKTVWIPKSVTDGIIKFAPDANGDREVMMDVHDWFCDKENI